MIQKILFITNIVIITLLLTFCAPRTPQSRKSPTENLTINKNNLTIKITYCQPSKKNRKIFGGLVPYNKIWRTGANEATEITFSENVKINNQIIKAGTYTLFTIPKKEGWTLILNSILGQWGDYRYKQNKDILRTEIPVTSLSETVEVFKISLKDSKDNAISVSMAWENTQADFEIEQQSK